MIAKYKGTCIVCGLAIRVGDYIGYQKKYGAWHSACDKAAPLPMYPFNTSIADYFKKNGQVKYVKGLPVPVIA